jgi:dimethyladenosine transferase 1
MLSQAAPGRVETYYGDVLSFNLTNLFPEEQARAWEDPCPYLHVMGNLPFSVATPLIIRWLKDISQRTNAWRFGRVPLTLTFQKEVAERLAAPERHEQRCRLSIMAQYLCHTNHKFTIKGSAFVPKPDVDVGVVKFIPRKVPLINHPFGLVEKVTRQLFCMRQKYCQRGLSTLFPHAIRKELIDILMKESEVDRTQRPYNLTIEEVGRLCDAYDSICKRYPVRDYNYRGRNPDEEWEELYGNKKLEDDLSDIEPDSSSNVNGNEIVEDLDKKRK